MTKAVCHIAAALAIVSGCHSEQNLAVAPPASASAAPTSAPLADHDGPQAPLVLTVEGPSTVDPSGKVMLRLKLSRRLVTQDPISLEIDVPDGATLAEGRAQETILDDRAREVTRTVVVEYASVPASDVVVRARVVGGAFGVNALASYRFGRPAKPLRQPLDVATRHPGLKGSLIPIKPR